MTWTHGRIAALCGAIAALTGFVTALASQDGWFRTSALIKLSVDEPMSDLALRLDPHFVLVNDQAHYDGVYYYAMALDPFAHGRAHTLIDQAAYRYGHPLHGWLAGMLSGGRGADIPFALFTLSLIGIALAAWAVSQLAHALGATPWAGLVVAVSPGLLYAVTVSTSEPLGMALVALALLAWVRERWTAALVLNVLCCLDKEQYVAVPIGLLIWEIARMLRLRQLPAHAGRRLVAIIAGPTVLASWYGYVHHVFHQWPSHYQSGNIGAPVTGWRETFRYSKTLSGGSFDQSQIAAITAPVLIALAVLIVAAVITTMRRPSVVTYPLLLLVAITACQGWRTLLYPHEIFRTPAIVTLLAGLVLITARSTTSQTSRRAALAETG